VPAPVTSYPNVTAALDYDTDQTYKLSPQRLLWNLDLLGLHRPLNKHLRVFWWNQRKCVGGAVSTATAIFSGWRALVGGGVAWLQFGGRFQNDSEQGTLVGKTNFPADTDDGIAAHFAAFINSKLVGVFATARGNALTITTLSWFYEFAFWAWTDATGGPVGSMSICGALAQGTEGTWTVDDMVSPPLNRAAADWHADLFAGIAAKGWTIATSISMEVVNPPDNSPGSGVVRPLCRWHSRRNGHWLQQTGVDPVQFHGCCPCVSACGTYANRAASSLGRTYALATARRIPVVVLPAERLNGLLRRRDCGRRAIGPRASARVVRRPYQ
jgi:hypothetical protein